jgi:hypothetical protein
MMPANGWSSSRIRKIAPETDRAHTTRDAKVEAFAGAMSEKPVNKTITHNNYNTAKKGRGIELRRCENNKYRVCIRSLVTCTIRIRSPR